MKKIIAFDAEGTIFKAKNKTHKATFSLTIWKKLARLVSAVEEEKQTHFKWRKGDYNSYKEWVDATFQIFKNRGLKESVFENVIKKAQYNDGVLEFFQNLDRNKWVPIILIGGFQELVDRACKELDISYGYGACKYCFDKDTKILDSYTYDQCDSNGKLNKIEEIKEKECVDAEQPWVFVGYGKNVVDIAKTASLVFGLNPQKEFRKIPKIQVIHSFSEISQLLNEFEIKEKIANQWTSDKKILIIGVCAYSKKEVEIIASNRKIDSSRIIYYNEYYNNFDFSKLCNTTYSYAFIGAIPHSVKGKKYSQTIHSEIRENPDKYPKLYQTEVKQISKTALKKFFDWIKEDSNTAE